MKDLRLNSTLLNNKENILKIKQFFEGLFRVFTIVYSLYYSINYIKPINPEREREKNSTKFMLSLNPNII